MSQAPISNTREERDLRASLERRYARLWDAYRNTGDDEERRFFGRRMDALQSQISYGPDERWKEFIKTLPGYMEY